MWTTQPLLCRLWGKETEMKKNQLTASVVAFYAAYFLNYIIKLCPSVVMPQIQAELQLSSSMVGFLSSLYFFPYALMQFFVGSLCRRFSAQRVCATGLSICAVGLLLFGWGGSVYTLACGRFLLGLGTSPFFIGLIFFLQRFFAGKEYVRVYGFSIFVSNIGSALASAPLGYLVVHMGRGSVFTLVAIFAVVLGASLLLLLRADEDKGQKAEFASIFKTVGQSMLMVFHSPLLLSGLMLWFVQSACMMSYQGLWCTKWTTVAFPDFASFAAMSGIFISIGSMLASLFCEKLRNKKQSRKKSLYLATWLSVLSVLLTSGIKLLPSIGWALSLSLLLDVFYGYAGSNIIVQGGAFVRENTKTEDNANIMGVFNGLGCFVQQLSQWLTGLSVDFFLLSTTMKLSFFWTYMILALLILALCVVLRKPLWKEQV